ncbi:hypothetical protein SAMD00019534_073870 [Acytostelium subglobosum LB1]|uniref:hypothetical protein n=1 Tax=Acytostelium subglobosum LB1 TaxID=1410327 RepID=UPI000644F71E|nr:hypothetical protein SAMD00019534_073870 [Acytostelium subglobosum LB1]GAM24212.1 hypothetical protein SAMD00019534_073870 [Acytostelium subglobosum LB1]|eukprot:XP_012752538.1 hypothetical protein SAMD00019534_073870 [Acytostelium subglobosum LB1]
MFSLLKSYGPASTAVFRTNVTRLNNTVINNSSLSIPLLTTGIANSYSTTKTSTTDPRTSHTKMMKNKVCFITGAAGGIGHGIAQRYLAEGAKVAIADLNGPLTEQVCRTLNDTYPGCVLPLTVDITSEEQVGAAIGATVKQFGGLDVVVSNAGFQHIEPIEELSLANWRKMLAVHLDGAFLCAKFGIQEFKKDVNRGGSLIFIGSVHSKYASEFKAPYVTAKHGLEGLTRSCAREGAKYNVKSNMICPGFVRTALVEKQIPEIASKLNISQEQVIKSVMLKDTVDGEFTTFDDINDVAVMFASAPSKALTGQSLIVSHGWIME